MTKPIAKTQPFAFDRAFDNEHEAPRPRAAQRVMLTLDEIETIKRDAHAAGLRAGDDGHAKRAADALAIISTKIDALSEQLETHSAGARADAVQLAYVIALRLARIALGRFPGAEIKALIARCIDEQKSEPTLVLRVNDSLHDSMREAVKAIGEARSFGGRIIVIGEPEIATGDCHVEWADGGLERNIESALKQIEQVITNFIETIDRDAVVLPQAQQIFSFLDRDQNGSDAYPRNDEGE